MHLPSNRTLGKIAVYGGITAISAVMWMRYKLEQRVRETPYFRLAFEALRQNKGAISLLGEPIKESGFDLANTKRNNCDGQKAHFEVRVKGPKDKGTIYFWATRNDENGWLLDRLELETKTQPDKRFLLKKMETDIQEENSNAESTN